jgi:rhodanese-related sulfurtransferase
MTYAGDVTPEQAWQALSDDPRAVLVDVRTRAEWTWVGTPDLSPLGKEPVTIEWSRFPEDTVNESFVAELGVAGVQPDQPVYFLCRSGVRSVAAAEAATRAGWRQSHNILDGFEGPQDASKHRTVAGWKVAGLPWVQG